MSRNYEDDDRRRGRSYHEDRGESRFRAERGHSTIGIISFVLALICGIAIFGLLIVAGVISATSGDIAEDSPEAITLGLGLFACMGLALLALILGVVGLTQQSQKVFPILGTCISGLVLVGAAVLLVIGILVN